MTETERVSEIPRTAKVEAVKEEMNTIANKKDMSYQDPYNRKNSQTGEEKI